MVPKGQEWKGIIPRSFHATLRHIEGKGIGYPEGYSSFDLFLSPNVDDFSYLPQIDLRGHVFNSGRFAANVGFSVRHQHACRVYGASVYYDMRNADHGRFNQLGVSLESLGERWDFRMNGYLPFSRKEGDLYATHLDGLTLTGRQEIALKGLDLEVGTHFDPKQCWNFYTGAIPYCYGAHGINAWGGKLRLLARYKNYVTFEIDGSYDSLFHGIVQGQLSFTLPFGPKVAMRRNTPWKQWIVQPVLRSEIIATRHRHHTQIL